MSPVRTVTYVSGPDPLLMERAMGIEPTSEAWEAYLKARKRANWRLFDVFRCSSNGFQLEQRDQDGFRRKPTRLHHRKGTTALLITPQIAEHGRSPKLRLFFHLRGKILELYSGFIGWV